MQYITKEAFKVFIRSFDFTGLFNQLGWNYLDEDVSVQLNDATFVFKTAAEKQGFRIFEHKGIIPPYTTRLKLEHKLTRQFNKHLLIFSNEEKTEQLWQYCIHEPGKPPRIAETTWQTGKDPELLYQRASSLFFTLNEEDQITIIDVSDRVHEGFGQNNEKTAKKFYRDFKAEHKAFQSFIEGIKETVNKEWYASLMLNRLMFCYFIQRKGFLDNNKNYLEEKLKECQQKKGKRKFYSFYRDFLLELFHKGLGSPGRKDFKMELGRIPYLNGGLFQVHELEINYPDIDIDDKAFERVFALFRQYNWHLDTRHGASGRDINPDVIGYIFEKYINDRALMGAYYTKEDITEYISKNCILPFIFGKLQEKCPALFGTDGYIFSRLKHSGDRYIYASAKKGVELTLPAEIEAGIHHIEKRQLWNKPAAADYALPKEIWRDVVERRQRYENLTAKIGAGEIRSISRFIKENLDIRQFAQDILQASDDPFLIEEFYNILTNLTVIDPTCGSGAFLFAALNILEPLYEGCINRMRAFVDDEDRLNNSNKSFSNKYTSFREVLKNIYGPQHKNPVYFIHKTIILRNLYGVDIMKEATEVAKLRLFLKLVATVDADYSKEDLGIEPLPDIDFNIRAGNTLVGFSNEKDLKESLEGSLDGLMRREAIDEQCDIVAHAFDRFKGVQLEYGDYENKTELEKHLEFQASKAGLQQRLKNLNEELNHLFHVRVSGLPYNKFLQVYQPFHWFAEFYEIINSRGGFDVIIGNPPYVEYSKVSYELKGRNWETLSCGNLYAFVMERCFEVIHPQGYFGVIVPLSATSTERMQPLQKLMLRKSDEAYVSFFPDRPAQLFDAVHFLLSVVLLKMGDKRNVFSTKPARFYSEFRPYLFESLYYLESTSFVLNGLVPKIQAKTELSVMEKVSSAKLRLMNFISEQTNCFLYYRNAGNTYYRMAFNFKPKFIKNGEEAESSTFLKLKMKGTEERDIMTGIIASNIYNWFWFVYSDNYHMTKMDMHRFPIPALKPETREQLKDCVARLMKDYKRNAITKVTTYKTQGEVIYQEFYPRNSKPLIDEIDKILAPAYGFTEEELDFIINYDVKYRMGKDTEEENEED